ncbi:MAG: hypothetical protein R3F59_32475 [Myxococcota bacterium]
MSEPRGLDGVDWSASSTLGPAVDVPRHLTALGSADPGIREAALEALSTSLWNQGALYPATAAAIPFLLARAQIRPRPIAR